jgi:hypothetical protein
VSLDPYAHRQTLHELARGVLRRNSVVCERAFVLLAVGGFSSTALTQPLAPLRVTNAPRGRR